MRKKENPGLGAGEKGTLQKASANPIGATTASSSQRFPRLTSERFPGKVDAIRYACDRASLLRAIAAFTSAGMFVRYVSGTYNPLTRFAIANEALTYARLSPAREKVRPIEVAFITARMDCLAREKWTA